MIASTARGHLLFDLDGTISDPKYGIVAGFRHALAELGRPAAPDADLDFVVGPPLRPSFAQLLDTDDPVRVEAAVTAYRAHYSRNGIPKSIAYPGILDALRQLRADGWRLVLATSKFETFAHRILDLFGVTDLFDGVHGALEKGREAKAEVIAEALTSHPIDPARTLMIGDREHDAFGAAQHGIATLGVAWGYGDRAELEAAGVIAICPTPADLPAAIAAIMAARQAA